MNSYQYDLVVIGAGPGGMEAAQYAGQKGLKVALVSNTKIGGRAVWSSLVPSKAWLALAEKIDGLRQLSGMGANAKGYELDLGQLRQRIGEQSQLASGIRLKELEAAGVHFNFGNGKITATHTVKVSAESEPAYSLSARNIIIASGSGPRFLPDAKPNKNRIYAPKIAPAIPEIPKSLVVAGGGVTGTEYAYAFAALGSKVTVLQSGDQLLPRVDAEVAEAFRLYLERHYNITFHPGKAIRSMEQQGDKVVATTISNQTFEADYGFIAIGRTPDLSFFEPEVLPLELTASKMVAIDEFGRTNIPNIYAVGDITGTPMTANRASMQARVAVQHILEGDNRKLRPGYFIEAAYTNPPIAQIGDMQAEAGTEFIVRPFNGLLKANMMGEAEGMLKLKIRKNDGHILGAAGFGAHFTDVLGIIQLAMNNDISFEKLRAIPLAHPSISEVISVL
ncbi:MAG: NAD(P)/FAD-dependent oxidoreductase [Lewinellaceae bacterium]|nr:NAD(P)/FAD-dependent oxidoreductase [Lewinellaceae bacterium]